MKLKKVEKITNTIKTIAGQGKSAIPTWLYFDINGYLVVESFSKLLNYTDEEIAFVSKYKQVYIYGSKLSILSFSKNEMIIQGKIGKIEFFEV